MLRHLAHRIEGDRDVAAQAGNAGDNDNAAAALFDQVRHAHVAEPVGRLDVDLVDLVHRRVGHVDARPVIGIDAGVRHADVDATPLLLGRVDHRLQPLLVADMAGKGPGLAAAVGVVAIDLLGDLIAGLGLAGGDDHFRPVLRIAGGDGLADAFGGAGDDGHLAGKVEQIVRRHRSNSSQRFRDLRLSVILNQPLAQWQQQSHQPRHDDREQD